MPKEQPELTPEEREDMEADWSHRTRLLAELGPEEFERRRQHDCRELAELIVEAMYCLIESGDWDPTEGTEGLKRMLAEEDKLTLVESVKRAEEREARKHPPAA